ncbi:hypothetical protein ACFU6S_30415 [Streptomyces sp. NPDC057456]|uniref:hypothetical protein n=1 Tax=Streptomyces sp. NPDC057456 TaxID=3346139 RepID=UPI003675676D
MLPSLRILRSWQRLWGFPRDRYTEWVGLYGAGPAVVIRLIEETDGRECVRKTWTAQGEVEG